MKRIIIALLFIANVATAQTKVITSACYDSNGWSVTYKDEVGNPHSVLFKRDSLGSDTTKSDQLISTLNSAIDTIPKVQAKVFTVTLIDNVFTITGQAYSPLIKNYSQLTTEQKAIVDSLKSKYNSVTGNTLTSLVTIFGSNKVTINGVEYDYSVFIGEEFSNAIQLANTLFNAR